MRNALLEARALGRIADREWNMLGHVRSVLEETRTLLENDQREEALENINLVLETIPLVKAAAAPTAAGGAWNAQQAANAILR